MPFGERSTPCVTPPRTMRIQSRLTGNEIPMNEPNVMASIELMRVSASRAHSVVILSVNSQSSSRKIAGLPVLMAIVHANLLACKRSSHVLMSRPLAADPGLMMNITLEVSGVLCNRASISAFLLGWLASVNTNVRSTLLNSGVLNVCDSTVYIV